MIKIFYFDRNISESEYSDMIDKTIESFDNILLGNLIYILY